MTDDFFDKMHSKEEANKMRELMKTPFGPVTGGSWQSYFTSLNDEGISIDLNEEIRLKNIFQHPVKLLLPGDLKDSDLIKRIITPTYSTVDYFLESFSTSLLERSKKDTASGRIDLANLLKISSEKFSEARAYIPEFNAKPKLTISFLSGNYIIKTSELANEVESLRYDGTINFMNEFNSQFKAYIGAIKFEKSTNIEFRVNTKNSLILLNNAQDYISQGIDKLVSAWEVCKPKMKESLEAFPEIIYENKN